MAHSVRATELSASSRRVVDLPAESLATVIGSPGSGKTLTLMARFLGLIDLGLKPEQIVVIAQTRDAANSYRDQLALEIQTATAGPLAKTLTSLAFSVLAEKAKNIGSKPPELVSGSEQDQMLKEIIADLDADFWPKSLDKSVLGLAGFRQELRDLIAVCLEHGIAPKDLEQLAIQNSYPKWTGAAVCYQSYLNKLSTKDKERFDSSALLRAAAKEIKSANSTHVKNIRAILIDDAQELTPAAAEFIYRLAELGSGVTLFGDPDVATLGFRVANPKAMIELIEKIASLKNQTPEQIFLEPTHAIRTAGISLALSKVSAQIEVARAGRQRKGLTPSKKVSSLDDGLTVKVFVSDTAESAFIASELRRRHLFDGVPWSKMAVVARSRPALDSLALSLSAQSVPVRVLGSALALKSEHAAGQLLALSEIALSKKELTAQKVIELLCTEVAGLDQLAVLRLKRALRKANAEYLGDSDELLLDAYNQPNMLSLVRSDEARKAERFVRLIKETQDIAEEPDSSSEAVLWNLVSKTKLLDRWVVNSRGVSELAVQAGKNLDSMLALFAAAARFTERNPSSAPLEFITDQLSREVPEDSLALNDFVADHVLLMTPSALIGKRFDTVIIPGLSEGVWPNLKPRSSLLGAQLLNALASNQIASGESYSKSELSGELRMLNKAIGAASQKLIVTATDKEDEQISQFVPLINGSIPEPEQSTPKQLTLRALVGDLRRDLASGKSSNPSVSAMALARLSQAGVPGARPESWYGLIDPSSIEDLTDLESEKLTIRPSQLENYLKCPLHWFLESHGGKSDSFSASLGTLIHEVLELSSSSEISELQKLTDSRWHSLEFEADWLETLAKRQAGRMLSNLASYLADFESSGGKVIAREQNFRFEFESIRVQGQVDRIEKYPDGNILVVDLKTGRNTPSESDTMGNPQLALYQMALLEGGFEDIGKVSESELSGAKLLVVGSDRYQERNQPAMNQGRSGEFKKLLLDSSEGMSRPVFIAQLSSHCDSDREYGSCKLHLTKAVSFVG
jgi:superfamily I DNA/RNA helicase/RecB family exonuclease